MHSLSSYCHEEIREEMFDSSSKRLNQNYFWNITLKKTYCFSYVQTWDKTWTILDKAYYMEHHINCNDSSVIITVFWYLTNTKKGAYSYTKLISSAFCNFSRMNFKFFN